MRFAGQCGLPLIGFYTFWPQKVPKTPAAHAADYSADDGRQRRNRGGFLLHRPYGMQQKFAIIILCAYEQACWELFITT